jgi:hypothetical protein
MQLARRRVALASRGAAVQRRSPLYANDRCSEHAEGFSAPWFARLSFVCPKVDSVFRSSVALKSNYLVTTELLHEKAK